MKIIARNLKREKIVGYKGQMRWFEKKQEDNEILLLINEKDTNENGDLVNVINHRESFGRVSSDVPDYAKKFYNDHKEFIPRVFLRQEAGSLFNEYAVDSWGVDEEGLYIKFK